MGWFDNWENEIIISPGSNPGKSIERHLRDEQIDEMLNGISVSDITSRDQIINPDLLMSDYKFGNSAKERLKYEQTRNALLELQKQQEAAYKEWYDSPEQQNIRDRAAGLNTDILGLSGSETPLADVGSESPLNSVPTNVERFSAVAIGITNVVSSLSSVASLATAFTTLPLNIQETKNAKLLGEQLNLQNEAQFGMMMARDIADLLGTAQNAHLASKSTEPFDLDSWFANDSNFESLKAVYGSSPRYASQLAKQRKAVLEHQRAASAAQKDLASSNFGLGEIISSPYYSPDQKLTMIQLKPFTESCALAAQYDVDLRSAIATIKQTYLSGFNVQNAVDVANLKNQYEIDYLNEANGKYVAAFEQYMRDVQTTGLTLQQSIDQSYLDMFNSDPSGEGAWKAAYLYGSRGGSSWQEAYLIRNNEMFGKLIDSEIQQAEATGNFAVLQAFANAFSHLNISYENYMTTPNFVNTYLQYYQKVEKLLNKAGYDVEIVE